MSRCIASMWSTSAAKSAHRNRQRVHALSRRLKPAVLLVTMQITASIFTAELLLQLWRAIPLRFLRRSSRFLVGTTVPSVDPFLHDSRASLLFQERIDIWFSRFCCVQCRSHADTFDAIEILLWAWIVEMMVSTECIIETCLMWESKLANLVVSVIF